METPQQYQFGKNEKLKSRRQIEQLFKEGKSFSSFPFRVVYIFVNDEAATLQAGFSVSARYFKKAVDRNRIKRLMKEGYRLQKNTLYNTVVASAKKLNVFFIYTGNELPEYELIFEKMGASVKRLQKITNENIAAST